MTAAIPPSLRLHPRRATDLDPQAVRALREIPTPNISDSMGKLSPGGAALRPMHSGARMAGPAFTVRVPPGDNLLVYKAFAAAQPGDVVVVDAGGVLEQAIVGEIMTLWAASRGLAGVVVHGAVRDVAILREADFPVYAAGSTHRGPYKNGPGELNVPVSLDGMVVEPGDLLVGDADGVVAVPAADVRAVAQAAEAIRRREDDLVAGLREGRFDVSWLDPLLRAKGYAV